MSRQAVPGSPRVVIGGLLFNHAGEFREAIESILVQTYPDFALLLVDDGSTDETAAIAQEYAARDPRVQSGVYQAGNRLLAVNRPAIEDEPERLDSIRATKLFGDLPTQFWQETTTRADMQGEIWRLFLFGMLIFLLIEGWLILPQVSEAKGAVKPKARAAEAVTL